MKRTLILCVAVLLVVAASCNKDPEPAKVKVTTSDTTYNLVNSTSRELQVGLYTSPTDRMNQQNAKYTCVVPAFGIFKIPFSKIDTSRSIGYYFDVHTADYSFSNWGEYTNQSFVLLSTGHSFDLTNIPITQAGYYFLNGYQSSCIWKAVDKLDWNNQSVWSSLDANGRYMVLTLNKDASGTVQYKPSGAMQTDNINNLYSNPDNFFTRLILYTNNWTYSVYNSPMVPSYNIDHYKSRDTIVMAVNSDYWVLQRQ